MEKRKILERRGRSKPISFLYFEDLISCKGIILKNKCCVLTSLNNREIYV